MIEKICRAIDESFDSTMVMLLVVLVASLCVALAIGADHHYRSRDHFLLGDSPMSAQQAPSGTAKRSAMKDHRDELIPNYIKAADLSAVGAFTIMDARKRESQFGPEVVFDIAIDDADKAKKAEVPQRATLTLSENEVRLRLMRVVQHHGPLGPLCLVTVKTEKGNDAWKFMDCDESGEPIEDLPF